MTTFAHFSDYLLLVGLDAVLPHGRKGAARRHDEIGCVGERLVLRFIRARSLLHAHRIASKSAATASAVVARIGLGRKLTNQDFTNPEAR
jgi:hypothetical protein